MTDETTTTAPIPAPQPETSAPAPETVAQPSQVTETEPAQDEAPPVNPRGYRRNMEQLEAIQARRREQLKTEGIDLTAPEPPPGDEGDRPPATPQDTGAAAPQPTVAGVSPPPVPAPAGAPTENRVRINVGGRIVELPESQVLAHAQRSIAGQMNVEEARSLRAEAQAILDRAQSAMAGQSATPSTGQPAPASMTQPPTSGNADVESLVEALQYGDKETATKKLSEFLASRGGNTDANAIASQVEARLNEKQAYESALAEFGRDYPEIVQDPNQIALAAMYAQQIGAAAAQQGRQISYREAFLTAGKHTRAYVTNLKGNPQPTGTQPTGNGTQPARTRDDKIAGKRTIVATMPPPVASGRAPPRETPQPTLADKHAYVAHLQQRMQPRATARR